MGNLASVAKALARSGADVRVTQSAAEVRGAAGVVLPGVGAFRDAAARLEQSGLGAAVLERIAAGTPFLGVCLGLQLLFESSGEGGRWPGLGVLGGTVERLETGLKVPHIGWNDLDWGPAGAGMARGLPAPATVYFVHSYAAVPADPSVVAATTDYGGAGGRGSGAGQRLGSTVPPGEEFERRARPAGRVRRQRPPGGRHLMIVFPAVDIQAGKAVRLRRGDFDDVTVFSDDPVELARYWQDQGAEALHVIDLDAARTGELTNFADRRAHRQDARHPRPVRRRHPRRPRPWRSWPGIGVHWVVMGTAAVTALDLLDDAVNWLGDRLVVGLDCTDGMCRDARLAAALADERHPLRQGAGRARRAARRLHRHGPRRHARRPQPSRPRRPRRGLRRSRSSSPAASRCSTTCAASRS